MRLAIICTPRTGSSWLAMLLASACRLVTTELPPRAMPKLTEVPDGTILHLHLPSSDEHAAGFDRHGVAVLTITRHPLDVLVSQLHYRLDARYDPSRANLMTLTPSSRRFVEWASSEDVARDLAISAGWVQRPGVVGVRYETLVDDPLTTLAGVIDAVGAAPVRPLEEAIALSGVSALREITQVNHVLTARAGAWRDLIPASSADEIGRVHSEVLGSLGYRVDADPDLTAEQADLRWYRSVSESSLAHTRSLRER